MLIYLLSSVVFHCKQLVSFLVVSFIVCWRLVTFALSAPYKYSYLLTYLFIIVIIIIKILHEEMIDNKSNELLS